MDNCCKPKCKCEPLCVVVPSFRVYQPLSPGPGGFGGELSPIYHAFHFNVDVNDHSYHLPYGVSEGQKLVLRVASSGGGRVDVDVDNLAGPFGQVQLAAAGNWAELHFRNCEWHLVDHVGATCV